jgi:uncharacterized protein
MNVVDLSDTGTAVTLISGVLILAGLLGVLVPVVPGLVLCWVGVLVWALFADAGWFKWMVLGGVTAIALLGTVAKYLWPGRNLKRTGVPNLSIFIGGVFAIVGFFVIPVVGIVVGFVLGIWLAEQIRLRDGGRAWTATKEAVKAVGLALLIELGAGMVIVCLWVAGLIVA